MSSYTKQKLLGAGAFGSVYLVTSRSQQKFAMKEVKGSSLDTESRREIDFLRRLRHPLIVSYVESFVSRGDLCIVMEYCDWGDLSQVIDWKRSSKTHFFDYQVLAFFSQIAVAVEYIHSKDIIHRDLKPQNVFLHKNMIKIGDFGVARQLASRADLARTVAGTPIYMSPEVLNREPYTKKADIWSLGVMLHEMITLVTPFTNLWEVLRGKLNPLPSWVGEKLKNLVSSMLSIDPEQRPSMNSLISDSCLSATIVSDESLRKIRKNYMLDGARSPLAKCRSPSPRPSPRVAEPGYLTNLLMEFFSIINV